MNPKGRTVVLATLLRYEEQEMLWTFHFPTDSSWKKTAEADLLPNVQFHTHKAKIQYHIGFLIACKGDPLVDTVMTASKFPMTLTASIV